MMTYKEFRKLSPIPSFLAIPFASSICYIISPYISMFFIRHHIRPNTVTLLMIIMGVLGGCVLMLPGFWFKILAGFIYYFWYTLDVSDGEVARITQTFSKGGKYLDWCAHLVCHPLFAVGMWHSFNSLGYSSFLTTIVTFVFITFELISRNNLAMSLLYGSVENSPYHHFVKESTLRYLYKLFVYLPNEVIIIPILLGLSMLFHIDWFYWIYILWALLYSMAELRAFLLFIWRMYKSE